MRYLEPETVDEALDLLAEHGDGAKVLAGGQSLLILMRERLVDVDALVGLKAIAPLREIEVNGGVRIGAMVTHSAVERDERIAARWPLLHAAEAAVSTLQVRNRGTLCGNVAHAFPTADPPAALVACDGVVHLASRAGGEREVAAEDFFVGLMQTEAGPEELVTAVSLPAQPEGARTAYMKYAIRPLDFAIVSVAVRIVPAADGTIADARIGLAGAHNHTLRAREAEAVLVGERPSAELLERAGQAAAHQAEPLADVDGTVDYKRRVAGVFTARAIARALG
jgi:carbon-monoxide dehydrogenase medium subunit